MGKLVISDKDSPQLGKLVLDEALGADAFLLGQAELRVARRAVVIPQRRAGRQAEQPAQIRRVLDPRTPAWHNSTLLKGDVVDEVSKLKQELKADIVVPASFHLLRALVQGRAAAGTSKQCCCRYVGQPAAPLKGPMSALARRPLAGSAQEETSLPTKRCISRFKKAELGLADYAGPNYNKRVCYASSTARHRRPRTWCK